MKTVGSIGLPTNSFVLSRYRHEMVWDSKKFYVIGGSTIDQEYRFDTVCTGWNVKAPN